MPRTLLACALLLPACDFLDDLGDSDSDDDDNNAEDTGDDDDDDDDDAPSTAGGTAAASDGGQGSSADDTGGADDTGSADGADTADSAPEPADSEETGAAACEPDTMACLDDITIGVCVDGEVFPLDCNDACIEGGAIGAIGCFFDEDAGVDLCWCDDGSGSGSGSEGGA